ncbi:MAG: hypothetical protein M3P50_09980, partial [Actinomycetota bacterium]|nr:hypothetical protein [Actinomycetota bacterium]
MDLDRFQGDEEGGRDVLVAHPICSHLSDPPLARRQRVGAERHDLPRPDARRRQLGLGPLGQGGRAEALRELEPFAERSPPVDPPSRTAQLGAEIDESARMLEACLGPLEHVDGLAQELDPTRPALDERARAQGRPDPARDAPVSGDRQLLGGERSGLVVLA